MGNEQGKLQGPTPAGIQSMDESLQKKFAKGIQYNMKIVIRGDRNTGKTTLFHRMEGKPFDEAYIPTNEIQVTSILWSYRVTNDTVKVEIWDVVDKGRTQKSRGSKGLLKMFNSTEMEEEEEEGGQTLDASFLDVYKGAHGVVFTFDITKQWTWKYIERELPRVPLSIPVIILANHMDLSEHRLITKAECMALISMQDRPDGAADIRYAECSMKNGFGLMHLHKFLSIPFLQLQQETLLQQLQVNREQTMAAMEELDAAKVSEDQNYNMFMAKMQKRLEEKKQRARQQQLEEEEEEEGPAAPTRRDTLERKGSALSDTPSRPHQAAPAVEPTAPSPHGTKPPLQKTTSITSKFTSKFAGFLGKGKEKEEPEVPVPKPRARVVSTEDIESFVPEGSVDDFLEDDEDADSADEEEESDSESDAGNPMIAADEDLSSPEEDFIKPTTTTTTKPATKPKQPTITKKPSESQEEEEEEEEEEEVAPAILSPIKAPPPHKAPPKVTPTPKPLKSALDIELTESEEETDGDGDNDEQDGGTKTSSKKTLSNGKNMDIFEPSPLTSKKSANTGLMLQFTAPSKPAGSKVSAASNSRPKDKPGSPQESPDVRRREKKKKKSSSSSKKRKSSKDDVGVAGGGGAGDSSNAVSVPGNPYDAIASLDAWLNSDTTELNDFLMPTKVSGSAEVGVEEGEESEEKQRRKSTKKHRHKKHSEGEGGGGGGGEGERKKKHKSHKSSRHREQ